MSNTIELTYEVAMAAGQDAGNRSMHRGQRAVWNERDWNAAAAATAKLLNVKETKK